ncbi:MAG: DUF1232 domain-containing protein [Bacteroidales bacterium]|nr:DUF1232 domain-containing protein [Bacteroidales bacterium]
MDKEMESWFEGLKNKDWHRIFEETFDKIKFYSKKVGRIAAKPLVTLFYVLKEGDLSSKDKALIYACILYVVSPVSLIPQSVFKFLGVMDEGAAIMFVYNKVKNKITPSISAKVENTLSKFFDEVKYVEVTD